MNSFYTSEELLDFEFKSLGSNVKISRRCSIYGAENIEIGNNVRIDDFCILSGSVKLDNYIHIAAYSSLFGGVEGIRMKDFSGLSSKVAIYAASDDYSGDFLTNPTVPEQYRNVDSKKVILEKHVLVGSGSVILPGVHLMDGVAIGAMSLVNKNLNAWGIYTGVPAKFIKNRNKGLLILEEKLSKEC